MAGTIRTLGSDDVAWIVEVMVARRAVYEAYSPTFWKPAPNAREVHTPHLASCVASERHCGFRTDNGFVIGEVQAASSPPWWSEVTLGFVDDFAVTDDDRWTDDGVALLHAAWDALTAHGVEALRVVTARRDAAKVAMLESVGLTVGESWWVAPAVGTPVPDATFGPIERDGVTGLVIPAPPVYDPGGPVLLVMAVEEPGVIARVPEIAAACGGVLAIVPTKPTTPALPAPLRAAGFDEVSQYFVGAPEFAK